MLKPDKHDKIQGEDVDLKDGYTYLMQFTDGNRIDLYIQTMEKLLKEYGTYKLTVPLIDKDNCLPQIPELSDEDYWVKKPTYEQYFSCCNHFWWVVPYCAKGLWREEILFAIDIMNRHMRQELLTMLAWYIGIQTEFKVSIGKANKHLKEYLNSDVWTRLMDTFDMSDYDSSWNALITTCELFTEIAPEVCRMFKYEYNYEEAKRSFAFIKHILECHLQNKLFCIVDGIIFYLTMSFIFSESTNFYKSCARIITPLSCVASAFIIKNPFTIRIFTKFNSFNIIFSY